MALFTWTNIQGTGKVPHSGEDKRVYFKDNTLRILHSCNINLAYFEAWVEDCATWVSNSKLVKEQERKRWSEEISGVG